ncbi:MAG: glycosyltransferase [Pseudomonadota bacterium]
MNAELSGIGAVVIGRNEGVRLLACLDALGDQFHRVVYVDSGSTDGSVDAAKARGAEVVILDQEKPFTAARARNAGIAALGKTQPPDFVQFVDGDCVLDPNWITTARDFLAAHVDVAVVCGRRRERFPEVSIYNRMCDAEWDTPVGEAMACGGDALMRWEAVDAVGGYNPALIAGEEPEMCLRMRKLGWKVWRLDAEMTLHDAAMIRFGQFWQRARRAGHAAAEAMTMYQKDPEKPGLVATRRALIWGGMLPALVVLALPIYGPVALWTIVIYPLQITRLALRAGGGRFAWERAVLLTVGKFAEAQGIIHFFWRRWRGRRAELIEYK